MIFSYKSYFKFLLVPGLDTQEALIDDVDNEEQNIDLQELLTEVDQLGWCKLTAYETNISKISLEKFKE